MLSHYNDIVFPFGIDSDGNYGYFKAGADTVTPFSSGSMTILLISESGWNISPAYVFNNCPYIVEDYFTKVNSNTIRVNQDCTVNVFLKGQSNASLYNDLYSNGVKIVPGDPRQTIILRSNIQLTANSTIVCQTASSSSYDNSSTFAGFCCICLA